MHRYVFLAVLAVALPAGITIETVVLFWTYPLSSLVAVLLGVALAAMLRADSSRVLALFAVPTVVWMIWLMVSPLSTLGYGPALSRFIALNLAVFLVTLAAIRWKQRADVPGPG
ncbi:MAG TPA: hypothetical protein VFP00_00345 [Burkholderiales bacterium]|nr:hypothetical protein [Burkholderiales bacterium]